MDIQELIEQIGSDNKEYGMFYFTMLDTHDPMYAIAVDCRGEEASRYDYYGTYSEQKFIHKTEDAIAFLFDCDIYLWELVSWEARYDNCGELTPTWNITLRR